MILVGKVYCATCSGGVKCGMPYFCAIKYYVFEFTTGCVVCQHQLYSCMHMHDYIKIVARYIMHALNIIFNYACSKIFLKLFISH